MSNLELMRSVIMDVDEEYRELQERCYQALCFLVENGIFLRELSVREYKRLRMAYGVVDELWAAAKEYLLSGKYPEVGEPLLSLELYGLYRCYYRYASGIEYINYFRELSFYEMPVIRLRINRYLVGLFILGECVMDYYRKYLEWLQSLGVSLPIFEVLV